MSSSHAWPLLWVALGIGCNGSGAIPDAGPFVPSDAASCRVTRGDVVQFTACPGDGAGCLLRVAPQHVTVSACTTGLGACDPAAPARCEGNYLVYRCENGQPVAYDCSSLDQPSNQRDAGPGGDAGPGPGICNPSLLACTNVPENTLCNSVFICRSGLTCRPLPGVLDAGTVGGISTCRL